MNPDTDKSMTVSLPADLANKLELRILATGHDESTITVAALRAYLDADAWHIQDIEEGLAEADCGDFASPEEVNSFFSKYGG